MRCDSLCRLELNVYKTLLSCKSLNGGNRLVDTVESERTDNRKNISGMCVNMRVRDRVKR